VSIIEQNYHVSRFMRDLVISRKGGEYHISTDDSYPVQGWLHYSKATVEPSKPASVLPEEQPLGDAWAKRALNSVLSMLSELGRWVITALGNLLKRLQALILGLVQQTGP
jgi:hypothetical protein